MLKKYRPVLLILVCLALGALVIIDNRRASDGEIVRPARTHASARARGGGDGLREPAKAAEAGASEPKLRNPLASFDKATLKDWVERPLFAPSRQRPAAVAAAARQLPRQVATKQPPPSYDLLGIVRDGDRAIALLRKRGEGTSFRVEVGDMIGGWRVAKMQPASVVLEREDGASQTVALSRE